MRREPRCYNEDSARASEVADHSSQSSSREVCSRVDAAALSSQRLSFFVQIRSAMESAIRAFLFVFVLVDFTSGATSAEMEAGSAGGTG